jgi:hypothetical protein
MTPTLWGRWQSRFFLLGTVGVVITLCFGLLFHDFTTLLAVLGYMLVFGLGWDILYQMIVSFRWDGDWPTLFQIGAGLLEGAWLWIVVHYIGLPGVSRSLLLVQFIPQYAAVWFACFVLTQGPLRALLPRWRYRGGQWF